MCIHIHGLTPWKTFFLPHSLSVTFTKFCWNRPNVSYNFLHGLIAPLRSSFMELNNLEKCRKQELEFLSSSTAIDWSPSNFLLWCGPQNYSLLEHGCQTTMFCWIKWIICFGRQSTDRMSTFPLWNFSLKCRRKTLVNWIIKVPSHW